jgi:hypothetical protein
VFQKIWCDLRAKPDDQNLRELAKFAKFVVQKFLAVAATNKKVFMELLFWKTARGTADVSLKIVRRSTETDPVGFRILPYLFLSKTYFSYLKTFIFGWG